MTPTDKRGAMLLAKYGQATVVPFKGYWLCGGNRIAQITVTRLLRRGMARKESSKLVVSTALAESRLEIIEAIEMDNSLLWHEIPTTPDYISDDEDVYTPPDYRTDKDDPVDVLTALQGA